MEAGVSAAELKARRRAARQGASDVAESAKPASSGSGTSGSAESVHQTTATHAPSATTVPEVIQSGATAPPLATSSQLSNQQSTPADAVAIPVQQPTILRPLPNNAQPPANQTNDQRSKAKSSGGGRLLPLPPARPSAAELVTKCTLRPADTAGSPLDLVGPVLAVRIASLDGSLYRDLSVIHPIVRVHVVDLSTGRYTKVLQPVKAPYRVRQPPAQQVVPASTGCLGLGGPGIFPSAPNICNGSSLPCLNRSLLADSRLLYEQGVTASPMPAGQAETLGTNDGSLLWSDTIVLGVPLSEVMNPNTAILFEVLELSMAQGGMAGGNGGNVVRDSQGNTCIAWGFLKTVSSMGKPIATVESRIPLGAPAAMCPDPTQAPAGTITKVNALPVWDVELNEYKAVSGADRAAHIATLGEVQGGITPVLEQPTPEVMLQYRLPTHAPITSTLRVSLFGAVIPAVRFIKHHDFGVTHTMAVSGGLSVQLHASRGELYEHPLLGRPRHLVSLPTDVNVDDILPDASVAEGGGQGGSGAGGDAALAAANQAAEAAAAAVQQAAVQEDGSGADTPDDEDEVDFAPLLGSGAGGGGRAGGGAGAGALMQQGMGMGGGTGAVGGGASMLSGMGGAGGAGTGPGGQPLAKPPKFNIQPRTSPDDPSHAPASIIGVLPTAKTGATCLAFSPDGNLVAVGCIGEVSYPIRVFEIGRGREIAHLEGHGNIIYSVSWSPNGCWIVSASGDGSACVWSLPRRAPDSIKLRGWPTCHARLSHIPPSYVYAAKFHPAAPFLVVTGGYDHGLRLWDCRLDSAAPPQAGPVPPPAMGAGMLEGTCLGFIGDDPREGAESTPGRRSGHTGYINCLEWDTASDPAGATRRLLSADSTGTVCIWDTTQGNPAQPAQYTLIRVMQPSVFRGVPITSIRVRPGYNQVLIMAQANALRLFDLTSYAAIRAFPNARCTVSRLEAAFSPDGRLVASGSEDGQLCLWEADTGITLPARAYTSNGQRIVIGYPSLLLAVAWSPTAHVLATGAFGLEYPVMLCT